MAIDFSNVTAITIPEGDVASLAINGVTVWEQPSGTHELCFTAKQAGSTVKLNKVGTLTKGQKFEYSTNGETWYSYSFGSSKTLATVGSKVYFRGENTTIGESQSIYCQFVITGRVEASGHITSLLNKVGGDVALSSSYCFEKLFYNCTALATAPALPSKTLSIQCYEFMFCGCTALTTAPALPATTVMMQSYTSMFYGCTALTTAPALPATTLGSYCYSSMFQNCTALATAPALSATTLKSGCYGSMFYGCTALQVSDTQTTAAPCAWTIPQGGVASGDYTMSSMFQNCLGTRSTNSPNFNGVQITYYTQNPPVG